MADTVAASAEPASDVNVVSLKDAARALGISESGVRKRLSRGQLTGTKDETGHWLTVTLPQGVDMPQEESPATRQARESREVELLNEIIAAKEKALNEKEDEIVFLRRQLESRDMLYAESLRQMRSLMPPKKEKRGFWPWSRRVDGEE
ncbi:MAG: hypothetical protein ACYC7E_20725 [Armatimonadota bacterium]